MNLYAESSAVLAWLLGEDHGGEAQREIAAADLVLTSELTRKVTIGAMATVESRELEDCLSE